MAKSQLQPESDYSPKSLAGTAFVGRQREMQELKAALEDALSGHGRLVMLVGEPGIGKTRTAEELAIYAEAQGAQVLWGWCYEEEGAPPYWPWVQPIRSYVQQQDSGRLRSEMGPGAADIAEVIPEVGEKLTDLKPPPQLEPEQARFRLFDSIATFLKNASQSQPLLLVLDDLHWADKPSLLLLQFLARQLRGTRLLLLGCYRNVELTRQHPFSEALAQLTREAAFQRVLLRGLSREDTGHFIEVTAGFHPPQRVVEAIYTDTEGNPFFMTQVVRLLLELGELAAGQTGIPPSIRLPEGVREVIGRRLNRLSEQCNRVLTTASIMGREFGLDQLHPLFLELPEDQVLEVLEEALAARVIQELPQGIGRYQFTHRLVQETLAEELSLTRRVQLHARIAGALEGLYGENAEAHASELAYHYSQAEAALGAEKLVRYSVLAGEQALAAYAYEEGLGYFQQALAAKEGRPMDVETTEILVGLGHAQWALTDTSEKAEAYANLERAFDFFVETGDVARAIAVAADPRFPIESPVTARALQLAPSESHTAGRLLCNYGMTQYHQTGDYEGAQAAFSRALAIARRHGDRALEMRTLSNAAHVATDHYQWPDALQKALGAIQLARDMGDPVATIHVHAHEAAFHALRAKGDFEAAYRHAEVQLAPAETLRMPGGLRFALGVNIEAAFARGDWPAARALCDRHENLETLMHRVRLEYEVGDFSQGRAWLERLLEFGQRISPGSGLRAFCSLGVLEVARIADVADQLGIAEAIARGVLSRRIPRFTMLARTALALLAVQRGEVEAAAEQYAAVEPLRGTILPHSLIIVDRVLGLLAQTIGNLDQAAEHFEDALAFCRRAGYRPELAWACCDYARALLNPVGAGLKPAPTPAHQAKAMSLLDEALAISRGLGMPPLMERVVALKEKVKSQPGTDDSRIAPTYPNGLTQREVEVLRLIAEGKSNQEIAEVLVISLGTVARHVSNIYGKIGTTNRAGATRYALREGLLSLEEVQSSVADE